MQMDFGFGENTGLSSNTPYTTIASNPMFMSFASAFDTASPSGNAGDPGSFNFDMGSLSAWPTPSASSQDAGALDDLFGGYLGPQAPIDYNILLTSPSSAISPSSHINGRSPANSASSSSPASSGSAPSMFNTPRDSSASDSDHGHECPKTKADLARAIESEGSSPFAPSSQPLTVRKSTEGNSVPCHGTNFPKTVKSDQNVEVLSAWRSITSNPKFKVTLPEHRVDSGDLLLPFRMLTSTTFVQNLPARRGVTGRMWYLSLKACIISSTNCRRSSSCRTPASAHTINWDTSSRTLVVILGPTPVLFLLSPSSSLKY